MIITKFCDCEAVIFDIKLNKIIIKAARRGIMASHLHIIIEIHTRDTDIHSKHFSKYWGGGNHKFILLENKTTLSKELHDTAQNLWPADPAESSGSGSGLTLKDIINVERPFNTHTGEQAVLETHGTVRCF